MIGNAPLPVAISTQVLLNKVRVDDFLRFNRLVTVAGFDPASIFHVIIAICATEDGVFVVVEPLRRTGGDEELTAVCH